MKYFFIAIFGASGVFLFIINARLVFRFFKCRHFLKSAANVVSLSTETICRRNKFLIYPKISYSYIVFDCVYEASRIRSLCSESLSDIHFVVSNKDDHSNIIRFWSERIKNGKIDIFYDPKNPTDVFICNGPFLQTVASCVFGLLLIEVGLFIGLNLS